MDLSNAGCYFEYLARSFWFGLRFSLLEGGSRLSPLISGPVASVALLVCGFGPLGLFELRGSTTVAITVRPNPLTGLFFPFDNGLGRGKWLPAEQAEAAKTLGYDGISYNYVETRPELIDTWRQELGIRGLQLIALYVGIHWPKQDGARPWESLREPIRRLRGTNTILWAPIWGRAHTDLDDTVAVAFLNEIADWCEEAQIKLCLYPHGNSYTNTSEDCLRLARMVGRPHVVGASINLHHERIGGNSERLVLLPQEMKEYLFLVSINGATERGGSILPLGRGDFDVYPFVRALYQVGYAGPIGVQCFNRGGDIRENLANDIRVWREWGERLLREAPNSRPLYPGSTAESI